MASSNQARTQCFGILFPGPSADGCLCINPKLRRGAESSAQLVLDQATSNSAVRKFRERPYHQEQFEARQVREVRIRRHLEAPAFPRPPAAALREAAGDAGPARGVVAGGAGGGGGDHAGSRSGTPTNVGSVVSLFDLYDAARAPPPAPLLVRYVWQVLATPQFMMHGARPAVLHRDLHDGNVFVHWPHPPPPPHPGEHLPSFFVGDLGTARKTDEDPRPTREEYRAMTPRSRAAAADSDRADLGWEALVT